MLNFEIKFKNEIQKMTFGLEIKAFLTQISFERNIFLYNL